jgi:hypothetical protein
VVGPNLAGEREETLGPGAPLRPARPRGWEALDYGDSDAEGGGEDHSKAMQVVEFSLHGTTPSFQIFVEMNTVAVLESVFQLVEGLILCIKQCPVASQEMVVDHVRPMGAPSVG